MDFPFNFFAAAFLGAWLTSLLTLPLWRKWCLRIGLVDDPGHRKIHDAPVPLAGGLAVLAGILLPLVAGALWLKLGWDRPSAAGLIIHGMDRRALELAVLAGGAIAITALGALDDRHELKALPKFIGQILISIIVASACKRITLFVPSEVFSYSVTVLWLLAVINAFNFMDNMNGLCAGVGAIGALIFALLAASKGEYLVAITGFLVCGATKSPPFRRAGAAVRAGRSVVGSGPGQPVPDPPSKTILDWRHQPSVPPSRPRRLEPDQGRVAAVAGGGGDWQPGNLALGRQINARVLVMPPRPRTRAESWWTYR